MYNYVKQSKTIGLRRNWCNHNKDVLNKELSTEDWNLQADPFQG
jgi:hypothetical protein